MKKAARVWGEDGDRNGRLYPTIPLVRLYLNLDQSTSLSNRGLLPNNLQALVVLTDADHDVGHEQHGEQGQSCDDIEHHRP